jgi:hypothetical protein
MKAAWIWLFVSLVPAVALAQRDEGEPGDAPAQQEAAPLPPFPAKPDERNLLAFSVNASAPGRFLLDGKSLTVGEDGEIRYVLVARSSSGANNATFEGIRCNTKETAPDTREELSGTQGFHARGGLGESMTGTGTGLDQYLRSNPRRRFYASAGQDGEWHAFKNSGWQALGGSSKDPRVALVIHYFCDGPATRTREDILARLRGSARVDFLDPRMHP